MRLLQRSNTGGFSLTKAFASDEAIPPYAILSHTWEEGQEVTFKELIDGNGKGKSGYKKIQFCGQQAERDSLQYFWMDTCCINQSNHVELQKAINSMFRWYQNAAKCYVYLSDISTKKRKASDEALDYVWEPAFRQSRWFRRGWTLQELLAPTMVEFFSREWEKLGDKKSLRQQIYQATEIPITALEGAPLSNFSDKDRFSWIHCRETKVEEDKAYSLLGIFDVEMPLRYGEGSASAFRRLEEEIDKLNTCLRDLHSTDPRDDKKRIEETKGGLLADSYHWILENSDFQQWHNNKESRLLWIKGDPGKGKTMLLCGIINELQRMLVANTEILSYFFCQATDSRINNATAVLRGLLYMLVDQQPSLITHMRKKHGSAGKALFEDANAWIAVSEIFTDVLQDPHLKTTYLLVDALDECIVDQPKLLRFIAQQSSVSSRVKWIVSSRNWLSIEEGLQQAGDKVRLSLELNAESVSMAVGIFIKHRVSQLSKEYDEKLQAAVLGHLISNADDTFLWIALVCQHLEGVQPRNVLKRLYTFPPGLNPLYKRMLEQIDDTDDANLCRRVLAFVATLYEPVTLVELATLVQQLDDIANDKERREIISLCGSFLILREDTIYFVHQSAKDFLLNYALTSIFPPGNVDVHFTILSRSLQAMSRTLHRDMYSLGALGYPIEHVQQPKPDPLAASRYSYIYWIDHLCDCSSESLTCDNAVLQSGGTIDSFLRTKYVYWLEALSLCKGTSKGIVSMAKLEALLEALTNEKAAASSTIEVVRDARRFIMYHKQAIESFPLQVYASALLFSPTRSVIRTLFKEEEPRGIVIKPRMQDKWSSCLLTLEGHSKAVLSVAFSQTRLASGSCDRTVKVWDSRSGECLSTLQGHSNTVCSVAYDSTRVASGSYDRTVKVWDARSGECLLTLQGHSNAVFSVAFSHDSTRLASGSADGTVKVWDAYSGDYLLTLQGHSEAVYLVAFSHDSTRLASGSYDGIVKVWDARRGECLLTLQGHSVAVWSVAFSHDSTRLASGSADGTVKVWDARRGECLSTLQGHGNTVCSVAFSHDSTRLASGSYDRTVKVWDAHSGKCLSTLQGHSEAVFSVAFSHNSTQLASGSGDGIVKVWDAHISGCLSQGHSEAVCSVAFSHDSTQLASGSGDGIVKIWDAHSGKCLSTLQGHSEAVCSVAFSHDLTRLASGSGDGTVKVWDAHSSECLSTLQGHSGWVSLVAFSYDSTWLVSGLGDGIVKVWDARSGKYLSTLRVEKLISNISFDINNSLLHTNIGIITISTLPNSSLVLVESQLQIPKYQGLALSPDSIWITDNSENLLWLPSEYRSSRSAVSKDIIAIGVRNGRVWLCEKKLNTS